MPLHFAVVLFCNQFAKLGSFSRRQHIQFHLNGEASIENGKKKFG